ncbi:MAG TPA: nitronate monooxygenase [Bradyrhizobium sp.]|nr:nitronate monooxygenase [Bradyrhizobium sp.]
MALPDRLKGRLKLPAIAAPMFLTSGPDLVVETCRAGVLGTFPALNQRSTAGLKEWIVEIEGRLSELPAAAPYGINLIVHASNKRLLEDLDLIVKHQIPLVITSLGIRRDVIDAVQSYGGLVFHDVTTRRHAEKAAEAGVDGIIAVCAGAGGHAGILSPFSFVGDIRRFFDGAIVLAGAISTGAHIVAAQALGADLAYLGTRFLATAESMVSQRQKQMLVSSNASDLIYTPAISGVAANFLRPSIINAGLDPDALPEPGKLDMASESKVWRDIWSAGQGISLIDDLPAAGALCARLVREYEEAIDRLHGSSRAYLRH